MRTSLVVAVTLLWASGCAHRALSASELDRVERPAFLSRIEDDAGPRSTVFREDGVYGRKLKKLDPREADRRLQNKLQQGLSRFQLSDGLRANTLAGLPRETPWTRVIDPAAVATVLESFLVEEVPANPPDYELLRGLGADVVVEIVVEQYGMRSKAGRAGVFIKGHARMFRLGGGELWLRHFEEDDVGAKREHLDPFKVGKEPRLFRDRMAEAVARVTAQFARDLNPPGRRADAAPAREDSQQQDVPPARQRPTERPAPVEDDGLPPGELPDPD